MMRFEQPQSQPLWSGTEGWSQGAWVLALSAGCTRAEGRQAERGRVPGAAGAAREGGDGAAAVLAPGADQPQQAARGGRPHQRHAARRPGAQRLPRSNVRR